MKKEKQLGTNYCNCGGIYVTDADCYTLYCNNCLWAIPIYEWMESVGLVVVMYENLRAHRIGRGYFIKELNGIIT